jgi:hypothetical protein
MTTTLFRLTNAVTAARWLADCESALPTAIDAAVVGAADVGWSTKINSAVSVRRHRRVRRSSRTARFDHGRDARLTHPTLAALYHFETTARAAPAPLPSPANLREPATDKMPEDETLETLIPLS